MMLSDPWPLCQPAPLNGTSGCRTRRIEKVLFGGSAGCCCLGKMCLLGLLHVSLLALQDWCGVGSRQLCHGWSEIGIIEWCLICQIMGILEVVVIVWKAVIPY
jgi:hypothetical protein